MPSETAKFQCVVITPQGTLANCSASSALLPAHDGYVGILAHHMPMFCKLGLGFMRITSAGGETSPTGGSAGSIPGAQPDTILLIDGGFAMVSSNVLTVIASQAVSPAHTKNEKIQQDIVTLRKTAAENAAPADRRLHDKQKAALLEKLIKSV
ncbi:MAG: F0F1 ATP synthase subunit epsilon [Sedimentisphaerales bacterium]|jgi:F0F1-type ATP synthase epsilon subunit